MESNFEQFQASLSKLRPGAYVQAYLKLLQLIIPNKLEAKFDSEPHVLKYNGTVLGKEKEAVPIGTASSFDYFGSSNSLIISYQSDIAIRNQS